MKTLKPILLGLLWVATLFLPAAHAFGQYTTANIPGINHPEYIAGMNAAKRMGCKAVRLGVPMTSYDADHPPVFPIKAISDAQAAAKTRGLNVQWFIAGIPQHATLSGYTNIIDPAKAAKVAFIRTQVARQIAAHDSCPLLEIFNEPDALKEATHNGVPLYQIEGHPKGWISSLFFKGERAVENLTLWPAGCKICVSLVGSDAANASWVGNADAEAIGDLIERTNGFAALNTYPNLDYATTPATFVNRYLTVTLPNKLKAFKLCTSTGAVLRHKLGEVGVRGTTFTVSKWWSLMDALSRALVAKCDLTWFAVLTLDVAATNGSTGSGAGFSVCLPSGVAAYRDLNFRP
jgi:hypothetical protein